MRGSWVRGYLLGLKVGVFDEAATFQCCASSWGTLVVGKVEKIGCGHEQVAARSERGNGKREQCRARQGSIRWAVGCLSLRLRHLQTRK